MKIRTIYVSDDVYSTLEAYSEERGESVDELANTILDTFFDYQLTDSADGLSYPEDLSDELPEIS